MSVTHALLHPPHIQCKAVATADGASDSCVSLAGRVVTLRPLWQDKKKFPRQLVVDDRCDAFVARFFRYMMTHGA